MQGESRASLAQAKDDLDTLIGSITHGGLSTADVAQLADQLFAVQHVLDREISLRRAFTDPSSSAGSTGRPGPAAVRRPDRRDGRSTCVADLVSAAVGRAARHRRRRRAARRPGAATRVAQAEGTLDDVEDELFRFGRIVDREPALLLALTDPAVPSRRAGSRWSTGCSRARRPTPPAGWSTSWWSRRAGETFGVNLDEYVRLAAERRDRLVARVRVAVPLTEEQSDPAGRSARAAARPRRAPQRRARPRRWSAG